MNWSVAGVKLLVGCLRQFSAMSKPLPIIGTGLPASFSVNRTSALYALVGPKRSFLDRDIISILVPAKARRTFSPVSAAH